jgi:hypothetical protein
MSVSITGIIINSIMVIIIIVLIVLGIIYGNYLKKCETQQNGFCFQIACPCDDVSKPPCFGFAKMKGPRDGTWYCSNTINTLVDDSGASV